MNRRTVGCAFVAIAAFLYTARYITAAVFTSNVQNWGRDLFQRAMSYVGTDLHLLAFAALLIGVIYLVWGEWSDLKRNGYVERHRVPEKPQHPVSGTDAQRQ